MILTEQILPPPAERLPGAVYGPVDSWRLGRSLGVDLLRVDSICSFRCVYCQLGRINRLTTRREIFVPTGEVLGALERYDGPEFDVVTFSGSGEPTLAANLGEVVGGVRRLTGKPVVVLTNSTLLGRPEVRRELLEADRVFCKLDACSDEELRRIDRPAEGLALVSIVSGIRALRREFPGCLAIQTMLLDAPGEFELEKLAALLRLVAPDEVQLNVPSRPVPDNFVPESRGNAPPRATGRLRRLRTIPPERLETVRRRLAELTGRPVVTRGGNGQSTGDK